MGRIMWFWYILMGFHLYSDTCATWIDELFPKQINPMESSEIEIDHASGCRIINWTLENSFTIFGDSCNFVPTTLLINSPGLYIKTTRIAIIRTNDFDNWHHLESLNIVMNPYLVEIEPGAFKKLENLRNLSISNNYKIGVVEPNLFEGLINLKELLFVNNNLHQLDAFILSLSPKYLPSLVILDLSKNPLLQISTKDLLPLNGSKIEKLYFQLCSINYIEAGSFSPLKHLQYLNLNNNEIETETFARLVLNVSSTAKNFTELNVAGNLLHGSPAKLLVALSVTTIKSINLEDNHFDLLQVGLFPVMANLEILDISEIKAVDVDQAVFNDYFLPNLTTLIAAKNNFPGIVPALLLPSLTELDLSENICENCFTTSLFKIDEFVFNGMDNLKILKLNTNPIIHITKFMFYGLKYLEFLNLSNCSIYSIENLSFKNLTSLRELDLSHNRFLINCSLNSETFEGLENLKILNLHLCGLTSVLDSNLFVGLPNLRYITLRSNVINELNPYWFQPLKELLELDLAYNIIPEWTNVLFGNNTKLQVVNLYSNRIRHLTMDMLTEFQFLESLQIGDNQFHCACYNILVVEEFLLNNNLSMDVLRANYSDLTCFSPKNIASMNLLSFIEQSIQDKVCSTSTVALIAFLSFITIAFLLFIIVLFYYLRWHLRYWIFLLRQALRYNYFPGKKNETSSVDSKYKYDAFVSYSNEDRNFVVRLVSMLETQSPFYTLCVFERDFSVGNIITESVLDSLSKSRRTILVLSDSFARSTWCLWEMHLAQHKRLFFKDEQIEPLIIVKLGDIMDRHMTPTLRYLIRSRIYLQWNPDVKKQKAFWQKLRDALAPPKIQL